MRLNETLAELNDGNFDELGEWQYFITVMGTPSATEPWGWQFDGHHAVINYFVLGDQVVMSPHFAGSEPVTATSGKYKGTSVLQDEQNLGLAFVNALTAEQRGKAILRSGDKTADMNLTEAWKDNVVLDYAGVSASALSAPQQQQLLALIGLYVGAMDDGHARVKMADVRAHLDRTWFAWIGRTDVIPPQSDARTCREAAHPPLPHCGRDPRLCGAARCRVTTSVDLLGARQHPAPVDRQGPRRPTLPLRGGPPIARESRNGRPSGDAQRRLAQGG
jgi:hypothetical protein